MKKCFLSTYHPLKDAKYPLTSFVPSINATPPYGAFLQGGAGGVFKLPNEEEAIFWFGVAWWVSFEKVCWCFHTRGDLGHGWYFPHVLELKIQ